MQYHFVVVYDELTDKFMFDSGTTDAKFDNEVAFDSESGNWFNLDELMLADYEDYLEMLLEKLDGVY